MSHALGEGESLFGSPIEYLDFDPQRMQLEVLVPPAVVLTTFTGEAVDEEATDGSLGGANGRTVTVRMRGSDRTKSFQKCGGGRRVFKKRTGGWW